MPPGEMDDLIVKLRVNLTETSEQRVTNLKAQLTVWAELRKQHGPSKLYRRWALVTDPTPATVFFFIVRLIYSYNT